MTNPKENESEELSTDELKSISGGMSVDSGATYVAGNYTALPGLGDAYLQSPQGSGSGMTKDDYRKSKRNQIGADLTDK